VRLTIVIPVLNEEQSVEQVARDCLQARAQIVAETPVQQVFVVVVSDGSTDRTVEIARSIAGVTTVVFEKNQGYGAAIQCGWQQHEAELLAFLDGDGTCRADFFVPLIQALDRAHADIAVGNRMGSGSKMPRLRRVGNLFFALLLGLLSKQRVSDSASGMRVVRRSSLPRLLPLPKGLQFTPAMSARALMSDLSIVEVAMPYAERQGRSKLSVLRDGLRFLKVILGAAAFIRPSRLTLPIVAALFVLAMAIGFMPLRYYIAHHELQEWMVYRFLFISMIADIGVVLFCATLVVEHMLALGMLHYGDYVRRIPWWWSDRGLKAYIAFAMVALAIGCWLVAPGVESFLATGSITFKQMHWSRVILAAFSGLTLVQLVTALVIVRLLDAADVRQALILGKPLSVDDVPHADR
jgi:glycosyltransferase involved in cell wall biosynthesis